MYAHTNSQTFNDEKDFTYMCLNCVWMLIAETTHRTEEF